MQHKKVEAPDTWRIQYDEPESAANRSTAKAERYNLEQERGRLGSKQVPVHSSHDNKTISNATMLSLNAGSLLEQPRRLESRANSRQKIQTIDDLDPPRVGTGDNNEANKTPLESDIMAS